MTNEIKKKERKKERLLYLTMFSTGQTPAIGQIYGIILMSVMPFQHQVYINAGNEHRFFIDTLKNVDINFILLVYTTVCSYVVCEFKPLMTTLPVSSGI